MNAKVWFYTKKKVQYVVVPGAIETGAWDLKRSRKNTHEWSFDIEISSIDWKKPYGMHNDVSKWMTKTNGATK